MELKFILLYETTLQTWLSNYWLRCSYAVVNNPRCNFYLTNWSSAIHLRDKLAGCRSLHSSFRCFSLSTPSHTEFSNQWQCLNKSYQPFLLLLVMKNLALFCFFNVINDTRCFETLSFDYSNNTNTFKSYTLSIFVPPPRQLSIKSVEDIEVCSRSIHWLKPYVQFGMIV